MEKMGIVDHKTIYCLLTCDNCKKGFKTIEAAMIHCEVTYHTVSGETHYATTLTFEEGEIIGDTETTH